MVSKLVGMAGGSGGPEEYRVALSHVPDSAGYTYSVTDSYPFKLGVAFSMGLGPLNCTAYGMSCPLGPSSESVVTYVHCGRDHERIVLSPGRAVIPLAFRYPSSITALGFYFPPQP